MITKKAVQGEIESLNGMEHIVTAYEEIAATRIRRTRDSVLKSRAFLNDINDIFTQVKNSYKKEVERLVRERKVRDVSQFSFLKRNGKTLFVVITANAGLYGDIIKRTFDLFAQSERTQNADVAVIGKLGQTLYQESGLKNPVRFFDFPDQGIDQDKIKEIVNYLIQYERVVVFFGEFENLILQSPVMEDISGSNIAETENSDTQTNIKYLFEPALEKILSLFEKEIFSIIFEQTIRESQLAKFASRMVTLESATDNIRKRLSLMSFEDDKIIHRQTNKKQNQTFASMLLWEGNG